MGGLCLSTQGDVQVVLSLVAECLADVALQTGGVTLVGGGLCVQLSAVGQFAPVFGRHFSILTLAQGCTWNERSPQ